MLICNKPFVNSQFYKLCLGSFITFKIASSKRWYNRILLLDLISWRISGFKEQNQRQCLFRQLCMFWLVSSCLLLSFIVRIFNISCCSRNDLHDHSCPPSNQLSLDNVLEKFQKLPPDSVLQLTNGTCKLTHPLIFTGVSNITIRGQGYQYSHISRNHMNAGLVFNKSFWHYWISWLFYRFSWSNWQWRNRLDRPCNQVYINHLNSIGIELQGIGI